MSLASFMVYHLMSLGVIFEDYAEDENGLVIAYSVPKSSERTDYLNRELAGEHLSDMVAGLLYQAGCSEARYRIRDEHWAK